MPEYEIKCWDHNSFDFDSIPFVKDAILAKKWAFAADYVRLYALHTYGGIYLDSDVRVFKKFDRFLSNSFFIGTEPLHQNKVELESAIMGSVARHPFLNECMEVYKNISFMNPPTCPRLMSDVLNKTRGYKYIDELQILQDNIVIYPRTIFGHCFGTKPDNYYAIHYFTGSWLDVKHGFLFKFCRNNDLWGIYCHFSKIASILKYIFKIKK